MSSGPSAPPPVSETTAPGGAAPPPDGRFIDNSQFKAVQAERRQAQTAQYVKMGTEIVGQIVKLAASFASS